MIASMNRTPILLSATLFAALAGVQEVAPELGQGWLAEFNLAARQILALAEATPAEKFGWRPGPGVRSISEVYMHIALGNFSLLSRAGVKMTAVDFSKLPKNPETTITDKAEVIRWLKMSFDTVAQAYPSADKTKKLRFFEKDATADGVFLRILVHNHEHMGQSIAYARMNGIVPPWSK
jgi:uncharacterized damage-inducible protein DinB